MTVLINIDVPDLDRAITFYCSAFRLAVSRRLGQEAVELSGATSPIYLLQHASGSDAVPPHTSVPPPMPTRSYTRHWTPVHLDFVVDDIVPALKRALEAGALQEGAIRDSVWGKLALLADPFGNGVCLVEFKGRGYGELEMAKPPERIAQQ